MCLLRVDLGEGRLTEETMWQVVVQIPKGGGDYRDIYLMEVVWKVVAMINNLQLTAPITFHDILHGFQAGIGTGTSNLEGIIFHPFAAIREDFLYVIFLDLKKAYDALDRYRCLEIMEGYGVGPQACCILQVYCVVIYCKLIPD